MLARTRLEHTGRELLAWTGNSRVGERCRAIRIPPRRRTSWPQQRLGIGGTDLAGDVLLLLERGGSHEEAAAFGVGRDLQRDRAAVGLTRVAGERPAQVRRRADQRGVGAWADHLQKVLRGSGFGSA